jgi:hypothetical protein
MANEKRTIFYSWQSEVSPKTCRNFIEDALKEAAKRLRSDPNVEELPEVVVDQGAANTPGAQNIAEVILRKIDTAPALVFDVTLVPHKETRPAPNPNVLVELGYALKSVGQDRIVLVMNTVHGKPEELPFDLRFRNVATYRLAEGDAKPEVRKALTTTLEGKLRSILELPARDAHGVELTLGRSKPRTHQDAKGYTHTHDYTLIAKLTNASMKRIDDWHLEVALPTPLLNAAGVIHAAKVEKRSNESTTLLRYPAREPLQVGDSFERSIQYRVTHDLYYQHREALDGWTAKAVAYVDGAPVVERVLTKIQEF